MNQHLRQQAARQDLSLMDFILLKIKLMKKETGVPRTIFATCPDSSAVIKVSLRSAKRNNAPIKFAATLNPVDLDPTVLAWRNRLYRNLEFNHIDAEGIVLSPIEKAMDKYFHKFNLVDLNTLIEEEEFSIA